MLETYDGLLTGHPDQIAERRCFETRTAEKAMSEVVPNMPKKRKRTSETRSAETTAREESATLREDAVEAQEEQLRAGEQTAADVRLKLESLMASLREANGHLVVTNLRSQTLADQMNELYEEARTAIQAKDDFFAQISAAAASKGEGKGATFTSRTPCAE